ncbi:MAG TPA: DegT/DnrJ/EryC1/StrS family aminotransferase [Chitinophagaceae bacterium]|nr:DegT/DnrJ/EryC1/StrS family aminotransferase [Chitinophagaceae bacterium]
MNKTINVTQPFLPAYEAYEKYLKDIWERNWLTNNGPLVQEIEAKLKDYLGVKHLFFCGNGTIAIQMAIKALRLQKEIITTPFSYVATTNSILWENCKPLFADITDYDFNIDTNKLSEKITPQTEAILATHVYGNPCAVEKIEAVAKQNNLKVIYDGAHAFGTMYKGKSLLSYGDISTCSFHATKLFHTIEGGCVITNNDELAHTIMLYRQFGHIYDDYFTIGINGKNSELHAAMGLCVLPCMDDIIENRKKICALYDEGTDGLPLQKPSPLPGTEYNYSYYPVVFESEEVLQKAKADLETINVFTRRYFYPSLNNLPYLSGGACPVSERISVSVLALPLYYNLNESDVHRITDSLRKTLNP